MDGRGLPSACFYRHFRKRQTYLVGKQDSGSRVAEKRSDFAAGETPVDWHQHIVRQRGPDQEKEELVAVARQNRHTVTGRDTRGNQGVSNPEAMPFQLGIPALPALDFESDSLPGLRSAGQGTLAKNRGAGGSKAVDQARS